MAGSQRIKSGNMIKVDGIKETNAALRDYGDQFKGEMRKTFKGIADFVASDARAAASSLGSTPAKVSPSIKTSPGAQGAAVALGGPAYPMAAGAEFGAGQNKPRQRSTGTYLGYNQFEPWNSGGRGKEAGGYFLWPTIREDADKIRREAEAGIDRLSKKVGLT